MLAALEQGVYAIFPDIHVRTKFMAMGCVSSGIAEKNGNWDGVAWARQIIYAHDGWKVDSTHHRTDSSDRPAGGDLALVTAVLRKDRKATAEFVNTYTDTVYAFVRRRLSPRYDLVDDLVQEVFLAAWENLSAFRGTSLRGWLLGIARHKVEDHYRKLLRVEQPLDAELADELTASDAGTDALADLESMEQRARQVLEELPEHYGAALKWRYWEKCTARQMADATGRSEKGIERLLARARDQFRRRWADE
jgi:RNA polymerase sigma-70 factor, ECF subfamily